MLTASTPCRLTKSSAASQILRSLVIIIIVNPAEPDQFHRNRRSSRAATARPISCYLQLTVYCILLEPGASLPIIWTMADLFDSLTPPRTNGAAGDSYSAKDIEVLEGLEPVRRRPGMYVGGTDERALHHLAAEALDNAMDEAVAGFASRIELELSAHGWVTVRDNGRGIPVDPHPRFPKKSALESS